MAAPNGLRCLLRPCPTMPIPQRLAAVTIASSAAFSTSAPALYAAKSNTGMKTQNVVRGGKRMKLGKFKKRKDTDRRGTPLPGERKAFRKRIMLSNNNALPVPGLEELAAASMSDPANAGRVLAISDELVDQLRAAEAFKPTQAWGLFRHPSILVRAETTDLVNRMEDHAQKKETLRLVITGDRLSGKSMLLLQSIAHAYLNDWFVVNIPEAQELTTACTEYSPIPGTDPVQYSQPAYALKMVQAIRKANARLLSGLKTVHSHPELVQHFPVGTTLLDLANGAKEVDSAWPVLNALWKEMTAKGHDRPPILLALDGLAHIMKVSEYRSPAFELIHSHDLALVRRFVDHLSGATPLPNGGAVIAATTRGNAPRMPTMDLALGGREAERDGTEPPRRDLYVKGFDERVDAALATVQVLRLKGVNKAEARAVMEYWAASGLLRTTVDEPTVSEKWTMGGNGILGEMERATLRTMRL